MNGISLLYLFYIGKFCVRNYNWRLYKMISNLEGLKFLNILILIKFLL